MDPSMVEVPLSRLVDVAVETWRLERWLPGLMEPAMGKVIANRLKAFLASCELETTDLTGRPFAPGLAVEVVGLTGDAAPEGGGVIEEMIEPVVLWRGRVVKHGQAIIGRGRI